jgi:hypothetical protein
MKKTLLFCSLACQILTGTAIYSINEPLFIEQETPGSIFVNNRILANVDGKAISVIDLMKKMDVRFYKQYPQYTSNVEARYQYYNINWKRILKDVIDKELILADALEHEVKVSNGDIRQELESLFGPNIIINLDKVNLSYDEAWKLVHEDIMIRRMLYYRANAVAMKKITPQIVRNAYDEYAKENINAEEWQYSVITIRDTDPIRGEATAKFIHNTLTEQSVSLTDLPAQLKNSIDDAVKVTISEEFHHGKKDLSPAYKEALSSLGANTYSQPIAQVSRNKETVFRIFHLKEMIPEGATPFYEMDTKLKNELLDHAIDIETEAYLKKLRRHFNVQEVQDLISDDFEPFLLK